MDMIHILPDGDWEVSKKHIAQSLGVSINTIKNRVRRGTIKRQYYSAKLDRFRDFISLEEAKQFEKS